MMVELRQLLYKEKSLDEFNIESEDSIFKRFFDTLLTMEGTTETDLNVERIITDMFNDACYLCTLTFLVKRPSLHLGHFRALCNAQSFESSYNFDINDRTNSVLCMVYYLLKNYSGANDSSIKLMSAIDKNLRNLSQNSYCRYERFFNACDSFNGTLPSGYFNKITISSDLLKKVKVSWKKITNNYNGDTLAEIFSYWNEPNQRNLLIDAIMSEVNNTFFEDDLPF